MTEGHIPAIEEELKAPEDDLSKLKEKLTQIRIDHSGIKQHIPGLQKSSFDDHPDRLKSR